MGKELIIVLFFVVIVLIIGRVCYSYEKDKLKYFFPVSIDSVCNMGFKDEVENDKEGGWTDQGDNDLRNITPGIQELAGIPFNIINPSENNGKSCIMLYGINRPYFLKESVIVQIGEKINGLAFLHATAWSVEEIVGYYDVLYEDGREISIPIKIGQQVADWWYPRELSNHETKRAWQGDNAKYEGKKVNLFCYVWENLNKDTKVNGISFRSAESQSILGIVAVTAISTNIEVKNIYDSFNKMKYSTDISANEENKIFKTENITGNAENNSFSDFSSLDVGSSGKRWIVYQTFSMERLQDKMFLKNYDGKNIGIEQLVEDFGEYWMPQIAILNDIAYIIYGVNKNGQWNLYQKRFKLEGASIKPLDSDALKLTNNLSDIKQRLVKGSDNGLFLVWQSAQTDSLKILLKEFKNGVWGEEIEVSKNKSNNWDPSIAVGKDNTVYIVYDTYQSGDYDVIMKEYKNGTLSEEIPIANTLKFEAHPTVGVDKNDCVWITWDEAKENWGKQGVDGLHTERNVGVVVYKDGRISDLSSKLKAKIFKGKEEITAELPQVVIDAGNKPWIFYRTTSIAPNLENGYSIPSIWTIKGTFFNGDDWSEPLSIPNSDGRNDIRLSYCKDNNGKIYLSWTKGVCDTYAKPTYQPLTLTNIFTGELLNKQQINKFFIEGPLPKKKEHTLLVKERNKIKYNDKEYFLFYGDLHRHTDVSRCKSSVDGSNDDHFRSAIDATAMDYMAITDHDTYDYDWWRGKKYTDAYNIPGRFTALYGFERTKANGHRNFIFSKFRPEYFPKKFISNSKKDDISQPWGHIYEYEGITIPHQIWDTSHNFEHRNYIKEPVLEIFQSHRGSYEYEGSPPFIRNDLFILTGNKHLWVWDALEQGVQLGFIAGSDHLTINTCFGAVYAEKCDRQAILNGLIAKRCFASTTLDVLVDFRVDGHLMGEVFTTKNKQITISIDIKATDELSEVALIGNKEFVFKEVNLPSKDFKKIIVVDVPKKDNWYYVRIIQKNGKMAWSSPIWLEKQ